MPPDPTADGPGDEWGASSGEEPDAWAEADRAYREKWSDEPVVPDPDDALAPAPPRRASSPRTSSTPTDWSVETGLYAGGRLTPGPQRDRMIAAAPYLGLGVQIAASMAVCAGGGYALDRWLGTTPWGILAGAMLGMVGIVALVVRVAREADRESARKRK